MINKNRPKLKTSSATAKAAGNFIREVQKGKYAAIYPENLRYSRVTAQAEPFEVHQAQEMQTIQWLS